MALAQPDALQVLVAHSEKVSGFIDQRRPDLLPQLGVIGRHALQVSPENQDLRQPWLPAQVRAVGVAVPLNSPSDHGSTPASTSGSAGCSAMTIGTSRSSPRPLG